MRPLLAVVVAACVALVATGAALQSVGARSAVDVDAYNGLGTWIDIFDGKAYTAPETVATAMAARGVRTAFVETANFKQPVDIVRPAQLGQLVEALHGHGIYAVAWYLPGFQKPAVDLRRTLAAVGFRTAGGQGFDGFALDIESDVVKNARLRTQRLLGLSRKLREAVGPDYALGAIITSPRAMELRPTYWPGFPYAELAGLYDVFLPMAYFTYRVKGPDAVYGYAARSLAILRAETGNPEVTVHLIGGTASRTTAVEAKAFGQLVVDDERLAGWSLYDWFTTRAALWQSLAVAGG